MAKPEWGTKRQCLGCGVRFYDLGKQPIVCPACDVPYEVEIVLKSRRPQAAAAVKEPTPAAPAKPEPKKAGDDAANGTDKAEVEDDNADDTLLAKDDDNGDEDVSKELDTKIKSSDGS